MSAVISQAEKIRLRKEIEGGWYLLFFPQFGGPANFLNVELNNQALDDFVFKEAMIHYKGKLKGVAQDDLVSTVRSFVRKDLYSSTVELLIYFESHIGNKIILELNLKRGPGTQSLKFQVNFNTQYIIFHFLHPKTSRCVYNWLRAYRPQALREAGIYYFRQWEMSSKYRIEILQSEACLKILNDLNPYFRRDKFKETARIGASEPRNHATHRNQVQTENLRAHALHADGLFTYLRPDLKVQEKFKQIAAALRKWHTFITHDQTASQNEMRGIFNILQELYGHNSALLQINRTFWATKILKKRLADRKVPSAILHDFVKKILDKEVFIETAGNRLILSTAARIPLPIAGLLEKKAAFASMTLPGDDNEEGGDKEEVGGDEEDEEDEDEGEEEDDEDEEYSLVRYKRNAYALIRRESSGLLLAMSALLGTWG